MKKTLTIFSLVLTVVFLAGCGAKNQPAVQTNNQLQNQNQNQIQAQKQPETGGIVNSIKDAMGLGKKMECTYSMKVGDKTEEFKLQVEGNKYKSANQINGKNYVSIFDGTTIYSWTEGEKTGTKITTACADELKSANTNNTQNQPAEVNTKPEDFNNTMNVSCSPSAGVDLTIPSDVVFTDTCETMKKSIEMMNQVKNQMPTQVPAGALPKGANTQY
jgi:hypothetical protein